MSYSRTVDSAVIPSASTTSAGVTVPAKKTLVGVEIPAAFTGASITFQVSNDDGASWVNLFDGGSAYSVAVTISTCHAVKPEVFFGVAMVRVVSASSEAADRTVKFIFTD